MKIQTEIFQVTENQHGERLDKYLAASLEGRYSRQKIQDSIRKGNVLVNGKTQTVPKFVVGAGDTITADLPAPVAQLQPETVEFDVIYHDVNIAIINKPAGVVTHPETDGKTLRTSETTLAHGLLERFKALHDDESLRPGIVHRLDKDTSGLLVVGLSQQGREKLKKLFADRDVHKEYLALVHGVPDKCEGVIQSPIGRHPYKKTSMAVVPGGKEALSRYRVLYASADASFSLVAVAIFTGRTHQIRVHLSSIGYPIIGDTLYTGKDSVTRDRPATPFAAQRNTARQHSECENIPAPRQMLHAWRLKFPFVCEGVITSSSAVKIEDGYIAAECPPPRDFSDVLEKLSHTTLRIVVTGMPGSGKSSFVDDLQALGVPCFSADACVKDLYGPDGDGTRLLRMRYGDAYTNEAGVDKGALGEAMRASDVFRREIEEMVHPLVYHALNVFWEQSSCSPLAVAEIPLYFETAGSARGHMGTTEHCRASGSEDIRNRNNSCRAGASTAYNVDCVIGVECPFAIRSQRLQESRGWSPLVIQGMERWQLSEKDKMERSDIVVSNTGGRADLQAKAAEVYERLMELYRQGIQNCVSRVTALWTSDR